MSLSAGHNETAFADLVLVGGVRAHMAGARTAPERAASAFSSELAADGCDPVAAGSARHTVFGFFRTQIFHLSSIADTGETRAKRQRILPAERAGDIPDRSLPNIPVIRIQTR